MKLVFGLALVSSLGAILPLSGCSYGYPGDPCAEYTEQNLSKESATDLGHKVPDTGDAHLERAMTGEMTDEWYVLTIDNPEPDFKTQFKINVDTDPYYIDVDVEVLVECDTGAFASFSCKGISVDEHEKTCTTEYGETYGRYECETFPERSPKSSLMYLHVMKDEGENECVGYEVTVDVY